MTTKTTNDNPSGSDDVREEYIAKMKKDITKMKKDTFFSMKNGFDSPAAKEYLGTVHVLDIGIPPLPLIERLLSSSESIA